MKFLNLLILIFPLIAISQPQVEWSDYPGGVAVAVDATDNIYSAYWDYNPAGDIYLTKRNSEGSIIWEERYDNTNNSRHEVATWVETDSQGNILVSGTIRSGYSNPVNANSILMKFSPSGALLWRVVYDNDFDGSSTVKCLVDASDNIYVLGFGNSGTAMVATVKKFNPSGDIIWSYFDAAGIGKPINFKFTPDNCLVISARSIYGILSGYAKIDQNGNPIWSLTGISSMSAGDIAGAEAGNSYIVYGNTIKKLNPQGQLIWEQDNTNLTCFRVEVGTDYEAVISGFPSGSVGAAFVKYNSEGNLLWENLDADGPSYNLLSHAQMKLDENNAAYLAASIMTQMAVCKVNADGSSEWTLTSAGGYASCLDFGTDHSVYVSSGTVTKIVQETQAFLQVRVFLQGPFLTAGMSTTLLNNSHVPLNQPYNAQPWYYYGTENVASFPNNEVTDWVLVELRKTSGDAPTATSDSVFFKKAVFLKNDGAVVDLDGSSPLEFTPPASGNLYLVIWHRNHIQVMSSVPLTSSGGYYNYDFTTAAEKTYGGSSGSKQLGTGIWGMAAGDGSADGQVNNPDKNMVWKPQTGSTGYKSGDFNMDGQVNNPDKNLYWKINTGFGSQVPE